VKYNITHTTKYTYSEPVPVCHNLVHLAPRPLPQQSCREFTLLLNPAPPYRERRYDYFGNQVDYFSIHVAHLGLTVTAHSVVDVLPSPTPDPAATPSWDELVRDVREDLSRHGLDAYQFTFASQHVPLHARFAAYAQPCFASGRPVLAAAVELMAKIHGDFRYDARATTTSTSLTTVFEGRAGVCQDFAHLQIACLRALGLPARYVSGYLRTAPPPGRARLIGADASHAWLSVWCGPFGWIDLDPTNNVIPSTHHVTVAWGRDYADVCPIQGVVIGGGKHLMAVSVDVASCD
jgi:transglutaminase-like putative cysteine protease